MATLRQQSSQDSEVHPALRNSVTDVPVTPGVTTGGGSSYTQPKDVKFAEERTQSPDQLNTHDSTAPQWNANWSFPQARARPRSPTEAARGARSAEDLLRRLSIDSDPKKKNELVDLGPKTAYPGLHLSGRVLSATTCVPYDLGFAPGVDWELRQRRGTSALFDSFSYLASSASPWNHTLVGWTGEIRQIPGGQQAPETRTVSVVNVNAVNKAAAPIPVDPKTPIPTTVSSDSFKVYPGDRARLEKQLERDHGGRIVPVWLSDDVDEEEDAYVFKDQSRWRRYAENELFPLFHYKPSDPTDGRTVRKAWADYYRMNKLYADRILEVYKPGDIIMIHDFYLMLLPNFLRQRLPNVYIGFFLHIPFPSSEFYRCLPRRKEILEGVLGANMVGFQSYSYSRHFSSCCTRILGFDSSSAGVDAYGAHVAVDVFPIGINASSTYRAAFEDPVVDDKVKALQELYEGKIIIVGRDRLDSIRGVVQKLQAFDMFLARYPEWREKVVLIQVTSPGNVDERSSKEDKTKDRVVNQISELVAHVNGKYGSTIHVPVKHFPQYLSPEEYFALLRIADVGLITSVRDGMNTTSLEYVICQREKHGPLILSEFSGTAGSLGAAIHINPWNLGGVADAINEALISSSAERKLQHERLYKHVIINNVQHWTKNFLKRLMTNLSSFDQSFATPPLDQVKLLERYTKASRRLFMLDYDGTLTPIVRDPQSAIPSDRVLRTIKTLAADPKNSVWIISGRDQAFLDEWMGHITDLGLSAEHGSFLRHPGKDHWENLAEKEDMGWQDPIPIKHKASSFVEKKKIALTWHYRRSDPEYGAFMAKHCQEELERSVVSKYDVEVMTGKANLEVRPRFVNKGEIAKRLVKQYGFETHEVPDFVLCCGDDFTDEDMFRSLRASGLARENVFAVTVGASSKQTLASWHLLEPSDVISCLSLLNGSADSRNVGTVAALESSAPDALASFN
ncbi:glycosyltransferase family 20-domain-containing protein [Lineolata rhizophorae]|uniref:Glycosyltransferase family 20-domain-containing protein n=1 Tax=Lineolata rhizophorae TaxID=578093 RepID=A0A6A6P0G7_9PEZI|nr:glycosyltransferase family 20-domain-containing protein [Lineolata rhizophorae]